MSWVIKMNMTESDYPALYNSADKASIDAQNKYFRCLKVYIILLVTAATVSFYWNKNAYGAIISASLFLISLALYIYIRVLKPEDTWYNGRAVAESVKTRTWRWIMRAEPYNTNAVASQSQTEFLSDLKSILHQNLSLSKFLDWTPEIGEAISSKMIEIRELPLADRLSTYSIERIDNQSNWYSKKAIHNKKRAKQWFVGTIVLHFLAILMLLYRIKSPDNSLPIEIIATIASGVLTWVQAKKYNELFSSYSLTAHEIVLMKGESVAVDNEDKLSKYIINCESAFSREHTQWAARKNV